MLLARYQDEMRTLRTLAEEFIRKHPDAAHLFDAPSADGGVERLIEGTAFLSALLRERLEDDWPEVLHPLIESVQPRWLRSSPAATVVSFTPTRGFKEPLLIPKGTRVSSIPVEGTPCHFTTCSEVVVHPITLLDAAFVHLPGKRPSIDLQFSLNGVTLTEWKAPTLRLFLGGAFPSAADLKLLLLRHLEDVQVVAPEGAACSLGGRSAVVDPEPEPLLAGLPCGSPGLNALLDYFRCPETALFLEVAGLERWRERGEGHRFRLSFILKSRLPIPVPRIDKSSFILAATPAVNLFGHAANEIRLGNSKEYKVSPAGNRTEHCQVWSVDEVVGLLRHGKERKLRYRAASCAEARDSEGPSYRTRVSLRPLGSGTDLYLDLCRPEEVDEIVVPRVTCTNGSLPGGLGIGDVSVRTADLPEGMGVANVTAVTPAADPPLEPDRLWKLYSLTKPHRSMWSEPETVRSILETLARSVRRDHEGLTKLAKKIEAVEGISVQEKDLLHRGAPLRGIEVVLKLNLDGFLSLGDLYLFASGFERIVGGFLSPNYQIRLVVQDEVNRFSYLWNSRLGERSLE